MLLNIINYLVQNLMFFTGAYSNNVFPEQLPEEKELEYIKKAKNGDKEARNKAFKDVLIAVKTNSFAYYSARMGTDIEALNKVIEAKKTLEELAKAHIFID